MKEIIHYSLHAISILAITYLLFFRGQEKIYVKSPPIIEYRIDSTSNKILDNIKEKNKVLETKTKKNEKQIKKYEQEYRNVIYSDTMPIFPN